MLTSVSYIAMFIVYRRVETVEKIIQHHRGRSLSFKDFISSEISKSDNIYKVVEHILGHFQSLI